MVRRHNLFLAAVCCAFLAACSSINSSAPQAPDLVGQLATADLSARPPQSHPSRTEFASGDRSRPLADEYPGVDAGPASRPEFDGVAKGRNGYELNFNDAGLAELVKVVLSDTLEIPYVFDPRVQGRVTLSTGGPVTREELLSILETVLSMNRGALVADGKMYRIVPDTGGQQVGGAAIDYASERRRVGAGYGMSAVSLKYVSSETMMRMLGSFAGENALKATVQKNLLIIRGASKERQSLIEIATMFDVDWMKGQSAGIYTLKSASPAEIIVELQQVFQSEGQGAGLVNFQPINRLNAVLVLTQKIALLEKAGQWIARLDRSSAEGDNYYVYRVENGKAKDMAAILNATFGSGNGSTVRGAEEAEVAPNKGAAKIASLDPGDGVGGSSSGDNDSHNGGPLSRSSASSSSSSSSSSSASNDVTAGLPGGNGSQGDAGASGDVRIIPDEINNKLLIRAPGRIYRKILAVLYRIDRPPLQVLINATLAEVTLNDNLQYGVQFYLQKKDGKGGGFGFTNGPKIEIAPAVPGLNFIIGSTTSPRVVLDALSSETSVRVVSSPSVVVLHNQPATLQVGDEVPIATRQVSSVTDADAPLVNEIRFRDTGVILKVTPRINSNGLVTMEVQQEISSVVNANAAGEASTLTPTISQRRIASMIAVQDGQMVVLGGLISEQTDNDKRRVPVLNRIPLIGDVVGETSRAKTRKELIVFLQPKIIQEAADAAQVAEELRSRMQFLAPQPGPKSPARFK
jgi:general secretion pathway protein D